MTVSLAAAIARLRAGGLVAYPTETVWGLAADSANPAAMSALLAWKGRDPEQPISRLAVDPAGLALPDAGRRLAAAFWPGPVTIVAESGGWRCSPHPVAAALTRAAADAGLGPLTATSFNRGGEPAAETLAEALALGGCEGDPAVLDPDENDAGGGEASSVVDVTGAAPKVLREGAVPAREILRALAREGQRVSDLRPFRALRYDPKRVDLSKVLVPPYDVVTPQERAGFYDRDPHNAIRLELTRDVADEAGTEYAEVAEILGAWQREGVLLRDGEPGFYVLRQRYTAPSGESLERTGFFGALQLEDYARRIVRPHERTMSGPKADRLKQLRATRTNLSPIFLLYEDREGEIAGVLADAFAGEVLSARDAAGTEHQLARLTDPGALARLQEFLAPRPLVIADGHHRYETALAYRDERRAAEPGAGPEAAFESTLAFVANAHAPGSLLLPIHRVVLEGRVADWPDRLPGWQHETLAVPSAEALPALLARHLEPHARRHAFAAESGDGTLHVFHREPAKGDPLTIRVIHREVIEGVFGLDEAAVRGGAVAFPKSTAQAASLVREAGPRVALYLNPLQADDVFAVTAAGEVMPQKSTFYYPKLPSGLVFRPLEDRR